MAEVGLQQPGTGVPSQHRRARPAAGSTNEERDAPASSGTRRRRITRGAALPGSRAVVGGLLVAVAVLGTFVAAQGASAPRTRPTVVAAHDLAPGTRLDGDDLRVVQLDLPAAQARLTFADPARLVGTTVLAPVDAGELVQAAVVTNRRAVGQQVSFPIDASRALGAALRPGDHVDVLATYGGQGGDGFTAVVADDVPVADIRGGGGSGFVDGNRTLVITVSLDDPDQVLAVTHAARTGTLTVVRAATRGYDQPVYRPVPDRAPRP